MAAMRNAATQGQVGDLIDGWKKEMLYILWKSQQKVKILSQSDLISSRVIKKDLKLS